MKVFVFLSLVAIARAGYLGAPAAVVAAEAGHSNSHRSQDLAGNYNFGYNEAHTTGGSFRHESGDAFGNKVGSYGLTDADGRVRVVKYVADGLGFRASVATNEPGTAPSTPAAAGYNAPVVAPAAPVAVAAAPVAAVATAPVAAYAAAPVTAYAAPVAAYAAPVAAAHVYGPAAYAAPAVYGKALAHGAAYGLGYGVHAKYPDFLHVQVFVFLALVAVARAGYLGAPAAAVVAAETGHSNSHRAQDLAGNYNFGYNEVHTSGGSSRHETGDAFGNKVGSYSLRDADGRVRVVKYVADAAGFRASVATNEPGTAPSTPAAAGYNAPVVAPAPVAAYAAPVAAVATAPVAAYAAPVAAYAAPVARAYAAPVAAYAAPVARAYAAPVAAAAHVYGPAVAGYGAYGAYAAPAVYGKALAHGAAYGLGYGAHAKHFF
ncbi:fibroin heavy chain-like [Ornithodoros turicata]|uniref:fibroin heavy chain-like n=1 Tax=Ornithodoros turicata TaxID=34597 RepID=UPI003139F049